MFDQQRPKQLFFPCFLLFDEYINKLTSDAFNGNSVAGRSLIPAHLNLVAFSVHQSAGQ